MFSCLVYSSRFHQNPLRVLEPHFLWRGFSSAYINLMALYAWSQLSGKNDPGRQASLLQRFLISLKIKGSILKVTDRVLFHLTSRSLPELITHSIPAHSALVPLASLLFLCLEFCPLDTHMADFSTSFRSSSKCDFLRENVADHST